MNSGVAKDAWKPFTQQYAYLGLIKKFPSGRAACEAHNIPYDVNNYITHSFFQEQTFFFVSSCLNCLFPEISQIFQVFTDSE